MFEPAECACTHAGCVCAIQATRSEHACGFVSLVYKLQSAEIERSWRWYRWLPLVRKVRGIFVLTQWRRKHSDQTSVKWDTTHQSVAAETSLHQHGLISSSWLWFGGCCSCRWPVSCVFLGLPVVLPELSFKCHRCTVTHSSRAVNNVSHLDVDSVSALQLLQATYLHTDPPPATPPPFSLSSSTECFDILWTVDPGYTVTWTPITEALETFQIENFKQTLDWSGEVLEPFSWWRWMDFTQQNTLWDFLCSLPSDPH